MLLCHHRMHVPQRRAAAPAWPRGMHQLVPALFGIFLAGCAAAPLPELRPSTPEHWRHTTAAAANAPTDLHGWWHAFGDPQLDALIDQALAHNLDVAQAVEHLRA